ncbi:hypothetical protein FH972_013416 [Carpinus fangiana]|uniref:GDSL esterase/lipase n=1 Tax=Carpinus fangiana TaxID=176857 RepID=A0A5N6RA52_9ROSI|nr:hypothetical protein FH972_013416 [Carpinus fangiana]
MSLCGSGTKGSACVDTINNAVGLFNDGLKTLVAQLNKNIIDATFIFINSAGISSSTSSLDVPCCKVSSITGICIPVEKPCSNRSQYLFWDAFHPTEILYELYAGRGYKAESPSDAHPSDISHLAQI